MTEPIEDDGTLGCLFEFHQDVVDDSLTNPVPGLAAQLVERAYAEAERRGRTIIQWRISCMPRPASSEEYFRVDAAEFAYLEGRRVMKLTAHTSPRGEEPTP